MVEYHDFLDVFYKKDLDIFPSYQKYHYKIVLDEKQKHGHALLYKILQQELVTVKRYLYLYSAKRFIQVSSASYFSSVLFIKKPGRGI